MDSIPSTIDILKDPRSGKPILSEWDLPAITNHSAQNRWYDTFYSPYCLQPALKRQWGQLHRKQQPTRILADGTRISVY